VVTDTKYTASSLRRYDTTVKQLGDYVVEAHGILRSPLCCAITVCGWMFIIGVSTNNRFQKLDRVPPPEPASEGRYQVINHINPEARRSSKVMIFPLLVCIDLRMLYVTSP
jgi:hypothetical protein